MDDGWIEHMMDDGWMVDGWLMDGLWVDGGWMADCGWMIVDG